MKVVGGHVAFVRRSSAAAVNLIDIYFNTEQSGISLTVNVQGVSLMPVSCSLTVSYMQNRNSFATIHAAEILFNIPFSAFILLV